MGTPWAYDAVSFNPAYAKAIIRQSSRTFFISSIAVSLICMRFFALVYEDAMNEMLY